MEETNGRAYLALGSAPPWDLLLGNPPYCTALHNFPSFHCRISTSTTCLLLVCACVQGFTGGSVPAQQAVLRYWQAAGGASKAQAAAPAGTQLYRKEEAVAKAPAAGGGGGSLGGRAGAAGQGGSGSTSAARGDRGKAPSGGVELPAPSQALTAKDGSKVGQQLGHSSRGCQPGGQCYVVACCKEAAGGRQC